jgi:hypothetical protein
MITYLTSLAIKKIKIVKNIKRKSRRGDWKSKNLRELDSRRQRLGLIGERYSEKRASTSLIFLLILQ